MLRRRTLALTAVVAVSLGAASATSLGTLTDVALWGTAEAEEACHVTDGTADVDFFDGVIGSLVELLLADLTGLLDVDYVELSNLAGDCEDVRPVVVVIGDHDNDGGTPDEVLARVMLSAITDADTPNVTIELPDDASDDELDALLGLLGGTVPNEVRIGFCPVGVTQCEP